MFNNERNSFQSGRIYHNWLEPDFAQLNFEAVSGLCKSTLDSAELAGLTCSEHFPEPPRQAGDRDDRVAEALGSFEDFKE